jgi:hypothetical protein
MEGLSLLTVKKPLSMSLFNSDKMACIGKKALSLFQKNKTAYQ